MDVLVVCSWVSAVTRWRAGLIRMGGSEPVKLNIDGSLGWMKVRGEDLPRCTAVCCLPVGT